MGRTYERGSEIMRETATRWAIRRDGVTVEVFDTNTEAFIYLHRIQGQSVAWAIMHEGWEMVEVEG
jgi:hypothetical protein